ncbi:hypothetical protein Tco_0260907 [Tanacetum coccineum]
MKSSKMGHQEDDYNNSNSSSKADGGKNNDYDKIDAIGPDILLLNKREGGRLMKGTCFFYYLKSSSIVFDADFYVIQKIVLFLLEQQGLLASRLDALGKRNHVLQKYGLGAAVGAISNQGPILEIIGQLDDAII